MNAEQVLMQGTLRPDGTVLLAQAPPLPAGPVEVLIRVIPDSGPPGETWWEYLQRARAELLAKGQTFRTKEEIDADRARARLCDEERRQTLQRMQSSPE
jgi:hypothetical protein